MEGTQSAKSNPKQPSSLLVFSNFLTELPFTRYRVEGSMPILRLAQYTSPIKSNPL